MSSELIDELPLHIALFACGAFGYWATKWANRRFLRPRCPPAKLMPRDEEEALSPSPFAAVSELCQPESEPAAAPA
eukprot:CAMPEP_0170303414 /NCGR_PEP_ID=MMETSP0116_2-20130129/52021_1 /TAXON_ID=400756 /ORGANISM="Durinskia baltica, Strain CSIRO CS-38" /LENGTH=75 /DNA_ID=CAMNT_0010555345 /DNA_START=96 /DNA_END=320 /DNA_ORIENTATION=+